MPSVEEMVRVLLANVRDLPPRDAAFLVSLDSKRGLSGQVQMTAKQRAWVKDIYSRECGSAA